jgi:hypothetical protein
LGFLTQAVGSIIAAVTGNAFPSMADAFFLATYPCMFAGILLLPMRPLPDASRLRISIDGLLIMAGLVTVSWYFVLGPTVLQGNASTLAKVVGTGYPLGDLVSCR